MVPECFRLFPGMDQKVLFKKFAHGQRTARMSRRKFLAGTLGAGALLRFQALATDSAKSVRLSFGSPSGKILPADYLGLSYETAQLADPWFFAPDNRELISLFQTLSSEGVLRLGGNSSEFCWWKTAEGQRPPELPVPAKGSENWMPRAFTAIEPAAIDHLQGFLDATGWKTIYGLNLGTGTPGRDAEEAAYVSDRLGERLLYFQIGNEPEFYRNANNRLRSQDWDFDKYLAQWMKFARAVIARVPQALFGGPDVGSNPEWVLRFAKEAPKELPGRIVACTSHYYAEGPPDNPLTTVERLLAPDPRVDRDIPRIIDAAGQAGIAFRMTEGNSCYRGGKPGVSNAFCSALWAADYLLKLASYGCAGVNLHGGGSLQIRNALGGHLPGEKLASGAAALAAEGSFYTPIAGSREKGFSARPVFYGMKLAGLLAGGRMLAVHLDGSPSNASAHAAEMPGGAGRLILLNKDARQELTFAIPSVGSIRLWRLQAPDLAAISDITLGGTKIETARKWKTQREERIVGKNGEVPFRLAPASGAALFLEK